MPSLNASWLCGKVVVLCSSIDGFNDWFFFCGRWTYVTLNSILFCFTGLHPLVNIVFIALIVIWSLFLIFQNPLANFLVGVCHFTIQTICSYYPNPNLSYYQRDHLNNNLSFNICCVLSYYKRSFEKNRFIVQRRDNENTLNQNQNRHWNRILE